MPTKGELNQMAVMCGYKSFKGLCDPHHRARVIELALSAKRNSILTKLVKATENV